MSNFGHRVIGHQRAAEEAEVKKTRANHFGPRVIGDVLARRRLLARQDDGAKDSRTTPSKKQAKKKASQKKAAPHEEVEVPLTTNVAELEEALGQNDAFYEPLYASEFLRPAGARKSALRLFLRHEMAHEDREERKTEIEVALK